MLFELDISINKNVIESLRNGVFLLCWLRVCGLRAECDHTCYYHDFHFFFHLSLEPNKRIQFGSHVIKL